MRRLARICGAGLAVAMLLACEPAEPPVAGGEPAMRRLTEAQYRNIIRDVFGQTISVGGRFDPLTRTDGLLALGARTAGVTPAGLEQFYAAARSIAAQVVDNRHRDVLMPCRPAAADAADDGCATTFFTQAGQLLFRRPLTAAERDVAVTAARDVATVRHDFYQGIASGLAGLLVSPKFLFVVDAVEPDPAARGGLRLTGFALASRLSFLLWNSGPDDALLAAAAKGTLHDPAGLEAAVDRMMASPKYSDGVRAFFADAFDLQKFETLEKDAVIYPAFTARTVDEARDQILRTIVDHVIDHDRDYRALFTTRETFLTPRLAAIARVPTPRPAGGWVTYTYAAEESRAGLATTIGFLAVNAHPGRSSPTIRGRAIRETVLCQKVPDPPPDVDFSQFNDPTSPLATTRERLTAHATVATCAGCHKITDPIGLALETFDGSGSLRDTENGRAIDARGELDGVPFASAAELGRVLAENPATPACLVNRLYAYALARSLTPDDRASVAYFEARFAEDGFRVSRLLRRIALSNAFAAVDARARSAAEERS